MITQLNENDFLNLNCYKSGRSGYKLITNLDRASFLFDDEKVQNCQIGHFVCDGYSFQFVDCSKRFKLFGINRLIVYIVNGRGFFKFNRGEKLFSEKAFYLVKDLKELEINGISQFIILKTD